MLKQISRKIGETRNYLLDDIKNIKIMIKKHKQACRALNYFGNFFVFVSAVSGYVSISAFSSLVVVSVGIASSAVEIKIYAIISGIKKWESIIKKKRKSHSKTKSLAKTKYC